MTIAELRERNNDDDLPEVFDKCADEFLDLFEVCDKHAIELPIQIYSKLIFLREALISAGIEL